MGYSPTNGMCWLMTGRDENESESAIRLEKDDAKTRRALGCGAQDVVRENVENIAQFMRWMPNEVGSILTVRTLARR